MSTESTPDWYLDETAHAGPEHLDPDFVSGYDRKQGHPDATADLAALRAHGLGESSTVVDLAAGTGQFTLPAAREFGEVVAVDVSPAMLDALRSRLTAPDAERVRCVSAGFLSYAHQGPPADAVHTRNALHQLPDLWKVVALDRIAGMLRPGGVLRLHDLVFDCAPSDVDTVVNRWLDGAAHDRTRGYTRADYAAHLRTEFSTFRWLLEPMLDAAGFEITHTAFHASAFGSYTCVRRGD
ncbi:class I SAM-dependent methyltransferase [Streptomyces oceani]|uniref:Methyltransferase domain-containing protein n=1 Tax=Streptomyces oceani TaxID=1075402 RepID=A0A1E7KJM0_9ACTN|nr:class I SAM-dependent methyltransferase [Streptomyces oceani]OEV04159.1 hypothetical protein AN216_08075 [Streptomyces oceani]